MSSNYRLKALIKAIRSTKTLADERSVIQRESAAIRTSFKEDDTLSRHANIAKLLYIHMLGYPAHFGQIECLKLAASPRFGDKRLGYLGVMLLLDENQEVLTLVTNSLKNDLNHANMYIVGLALCTLGNISSEAMARDLALEIEKLLGSSNSYIRRKAALCAMRVCRKIPDLVDQFAGKARAMLSDRNHGTLLCGVTLATELCLLDTDEERSCVLAYRKTVPLLVRHLKSLSTAGYSPEHDVSGITDPFLQCKILHLLRILGTGDPETSEVMNDILAQVASNTEGSKNVGNAILYEAVLTILEIEADTGLRVLAVNILGRFLSNKDNNIRYVALNTLNKVVSLDTNAVQRHRNVILDCLRDGDISIRRRALELSYALINESNIKVLIRELLAFLEIADAEFKTTMTTQICLAADRFSPNKRWHVDTILRAMKLAGNYVKEELVSSFITLICHTPELQSYTAHKLYEALSQDMTQEALTMSGLWIIGEYGDILLQPFSKNAFDDDHTEDMPAIPQNDLVDLLERALNSPASHLNIQEYAMISLVKLSVRITDPHEISRIQALLVGKSRSFEVEVQQRAVEFSQMFAHPDIKSGLLERMPLPEIKKTLALPTKARKPIPVTSPSRSTTAAKDAATIFDLLGGGAEGEHTGAGSGRSDRHVGNGSSQPTTDLLADLFGETAPRTKTAPTKMISEPAREAVVPASNEKVAYDRNGLRIALVPSVDTKNPQIVNILAHFTSTAGATLDKVSFQAAVPKTQKLQMLAMSGTTVSPSSPQRQQLRIMTASPTSSSTIRLRLRISFSIDDQSFNDQTDWSSTV